jgi:hypothetical protein
MPNSTHVISTKFTLSLHFTVELGDVGVEGRIDNLELMEERLFKSTEGGCFGGTSRVVKVDTYVSISMSTMMAIG